VTRGGRFTPLYGGICLFGNKTTNPCGPKSTLSCSCWNKREMGGEREKTTR
jgi:hypothetical protein